MSHISINKKDLYWSYLGSILRVFTNILLLPIIIHFLTEDELGLWYVYSTIAQFVVLLDFGFAPTFARNIAYVWCGASELKSQYFVNVEIQRTNWYEFKSIIETCKILYLFIAVISAIFLFTIGSIYVVKISSKAYLYTWIIYATAIVTNILYGYYTSLLRGVGAIAENNKAAVYSKIVQFLTSIILLFLGYGLLGLSISYLLSGITIRLFSKKLFEQYEGIGYNIRSIVINDKIKSCIAKLKILWHNAVKDGLVTLSNFLSSQANTLLCSFAISLSTTGSYGLSVQIATLVAAIAGIPFSTYQTQMQEMAITGNIDGNRQVFSRSIFQYVISFVVMSSLAFICIPIITLIKPDFDFNPTMFLVILVQFFILNYYSLFASFISSYNTLPYVKSFIVTSIASVLLSSILVFTTNLGIWSLILAPIITSIYNLLYWPTYVCRRILSVSFQTFCIEGYKHSIQQLKLSLIAKYNK